MLGAFAVDELLRRLERFAAHAVEAGVDVLVDVPAVVDPLQEVTHELLVALVGGANEEVRLCAHAPPAELPLLPWSLRQKPVDLRRRQALVEHATGLLDAQTGALGVIDEGGDRIRASMPRDVQVKWRELLATRKSPHENSDFPVYGVRVGHLDDQHAVLLQEARRLAQSNEGIDHVLEDIEHHDGAEFLLQ